MSEKPQGDPVSIEVNEEEPRQPRKGIFAKLFGVEERVVDNIETTKRSIAKRIGKGNKKVLGAIDELREMIDGEQLVSDIASLRKELTAEKTKVVGLRAQVQGYESVYGPKGKDIITEQRKRIVDLEAESEQVEENFRAQIEKLKEKIQAESEKEQSVQKEFKQHKSKVKKVEDQLNKQRKETERLEKDIDAEVEKRVSALRKELQEQIDLLKGQTKAAVAVEIQEVVEITEGFHVAMKEKLEEMVGEENPGSVPIIDSSSIIQEQQKIWIDRWSSLGEKADQAEIGNMAYLHASMIFEEFERAYAQNSFRQAYQLLWQFVGSVKAAEFYYEQVMSSSEAFDDEDGGLTSEQRQVVRDIEAEGKNEWLDKNKALINFYEFVGVENFTEGKDLKKALRDAAVKMHPDKPTGDEETFKILSSAMDALNNEKNFYDACLRTFYSL